MLFVSSEAFLFWLEMFRRNGISNSDDVEEKKKERAYYVYIVLYIYLPLSRTIRRGRSTTISIKKIIITSQKIEKDAIIFHK